MSRKKSEYALYRGDEFIMIGTIDELAKFKNVKKSTIMFYGSPAYGKRTKKGYMLVKVEE